MFNLFNCNPHPSPGFAGAVEGETIPLESPIKFYSLNGTDNHISFPAPTYLPQGDSSRTVSFFIRPNARTTDHWVFAYGSGATNQAFAVTFLAATGGQRISVFGYGHDVHGTKVLRNDVWYHVCCTYDSATGALKTYIDGLLDINTTTTDYNTGASEFRIGNISFEATYRYSGEIRKVKVYDRALSHTEVLTLFSSGWIDTTFDVQGQDPNFSLVAGGYVWVSSFTSNNVAKIDPVNKTLVGLISGEGLTRPAGMCLFDGYLWISNGVDKVYYANPETLEIVGSISGFNGALGLATDGTYLWVNNYLAGSISKVNTTTKAIVDTYALGITQNHALYFFHGYLYALGLEDTVIKKVNPATGAVVKTITGLHGASQMVEVGANYWVTNYYGNSISKIDKATETVQATYEGFTTPWGLEYDGNYLWVMEESNSTVNGHIYVVRTTDGAILETCDLYQTHGSLAFAGDLIWCGGHTDQCVRAFRTDFPHTQRLYDVASGKVFEALCGEGSGTTCIDTVGGKNGEIVGTTTSFHGSE